VCDLYWGRNFITNKISKILRTSTRSSILLITSHFLSTIISAVGTVYVARILGSTRYGILAIAQIPINIGLLFTQIGLANALITFVAQYRSENQKENVNNIAKAGYLISITLGLFVSSTIFLLAGIIANQVFNRAELEPLIKILAFSILGKTISSPSKSILLGFEKSGTISILKVINTIIDGVLPPLFVYLGYGVVGKAIGTTSSFMIAGFITLLPTIQLFRGSDDFFNSFNGVTTAAKTLLIFSYPLFLSRILNGFLSQVYNVILPFYVEPEIIGNYSVAFHFVSLIRIITLPVTNAFLPMFSQLKINSSYYNIYKNAVKYLALIIYFIVSFLFTLNNQIMSILYPNYTLAPTYLQLFVLSYLLTGLGGPFLSVVLNSQNRTDIIFRRTVLTIIFGLPLGIFLIPKIGIVGLILTNLTTSIISALFVYSWIKKHFGIAVDIRNTVKIFLATLFSVIITKLYLNQFIIVPVMQLITGGIILSISYGFGIIVLGAIKKDDINNLRKLANSFGPISKNVVKVLNLIERLIPN
jgi:O-antigen/teichoic acid export membrane protein